MRRRLPITKLAGLGFVLSVFVFVASSAKPATAAELEVIEEGKLHVALNGDMPGTGLEDGKLTGFDGQVMSWIASELGLEVVPHLMEWASEIESVKAGRVDAMHGMMAWTAPREKVIRITNPIYYAGILIVQKKGQNWNKIEDLEGATFGTITGFAEIPDLKNIEGLNLKLYDTSDAAIRDLLAGRVEGITADPPLIHWAIMHNPDWDIHAVPLDEPFRPDYPQLTGRYGIVFGLNRDAASLEQAFNEKIAELWRTCSNLDIAAQYEMDSMAWFRPPSQCRRCGVDRPEDWAFPTLPARCKP